MKKLSLVFNVVKACQKSLVKYDIIFLGKSYVLPIKMRQQM